MSLGTNLYTLRARAGMSQDTLAEKLEVSRQSVSKWETDASVPELEKLIKLAELFDVTLDELIRGDVHEPSARPLSEEPRRDAWGPGCGKSLVSHGQLTAGNVLLILSAALPLALLLFWGLSGLLLGAYLDLILLPCGVICRKCPKRAALWCGWVVWLWADAFVTGAMGVSTWAWLTSLWGNPEILALMGGRLILSAVMSVSLLGMTVWTLWSFRRVRLPRTWKNIALTVAAWLARVAVGVLAGYILAWLTRTGNTRLRSLVYSPLFLLQDALTPAAIVLTVALLRKRKGEE